MNASDFPSAIAKIRWAQAHLDSIKGILAGARERKSYAVEREQNVDATRYAVVLKIREQLPLEDLALISGDCVHNLRSALEHVIYQIAVRETGDPPRDYKRLQFPIGSDYAEFVTQLWRVKHLSTDIRRALEQAQSYHRPHGQLPPLLPILADHDNADKHQLLRVVLTTISDVYFEDLTIGGVPVGFNNVGARIEVRNPTLPLHHYAELGAIVFPRPTPHAKFKYVADVHVAVRHTPGPTGFIFTSVDYLMERLISEVKTAINIVAKSVT